MSTSPLPLPDAAETPEDVSDLIAAADVLTVWRDDPLTYVEQAYESDPWGHPLQLDLVQRQILTYVGAYDRVAVRTCHGVGKTATAAMIVH